MSDRVQFVIPGEPNVKKRPRFGKGRTYSDPQMVIDETLVATYFRQQVKRWRPRPDMLHMTCRFVVGTRHRKDLDNIVKLVRDALNGIAYVDDSQITSDRNIIEYTRGNPHTIVSLAFTGDLQWPGNHPAPQGGTK